MKRLCVCLLALVMLCSCFTGCKKKETASSQPVSMYDLSRAMLSAASFGEMKYVSSSDDGAEEKFDYISDLDYEKIDSFFVSYAEDGKGNADEIAVLRVKQSADTDAAVASLQRHLEKRGNLYRTYDPSQSEKVGKGVVFGSDTFAVLIVSSDNGAVRKAFEDFLKNN